MPEHPTILLYSLPIRWHLVRTTEHLRCLRCRACYPGRLMEKVVDGVCEECREEQPPMRDDIDAAKRWEDNHAKET